MHSSIIRGLIATALGIAALIAGAAPARAQGFRREGRIAARESRQAGRFDARNNGNWGGYYGNGYYAPGYYGSPGPSYGYGPPAFYAPRAGYGRQTPYGRDLVYHGRERALLGVTLGETPQGVVNVQHVTPDSPADIAGVRPGDEILAINGRQVYSYRDVTRIVADHLPNDVLDLSIGRNGRERQVEAVLAARPLGGQSPDLGPDGFPSNRNQYPEAYGNPGPGGYYSPRQARRAGNAPLGPNQYDQPYAY